MTTEEMTNDDPLKERDYARRCWTCRHDIEQNDLVGDCQVYRRDIYHHDTFPCASYARLSRSGLTAREGK